MRKRYKSRKEAIAVRTKAVECAALVLANQEGPFAPSCWSLAVFFELYIAGGSEATVKAFGPKKTPVLKLVRKN